MLIAAVVVAAVVLVTDLVLVVRRGGGEDLVGAQMTRAATPTTRAQPLVLEDDLRRQVAELALRGHRLQAIELLRAATGCPMTEAKAVVDSIPRGDSYAPAETVLAANRVFDEVRELIRQDRRPEAVLHLHQAAGLTLAEAEAAVRRLRSR
ncbi:hypothetical protein [Actinoplanes sp. RD1]|uniref:hypothetical protein n=1 Tax=Actinoplanes sp. RD1 TaxID=3064538 RepID=UPI002740BBA3|nr:hypothetical protein [Actinoplanes sp. RD1]